MTHHNFIRTIFIGGILMACDGHAGADILRCVAEDGTITYTNIGCENMEEGHEYSNPDSSLTAKEKIAPRSGMVADAETGRATAWARKRVRNRDIALDVETMKAAKSSMLTMDQASHFSSDKEFVALDKRNKIWFDFH